MNGSPEPLPPPAFYRFLTAFLLAALIAVLVAIGIVELVYGGSPK
jgi:hypothetical protein